jgi:tetratricopeptide (TPR) repeat protein
MYLNIAKPVPGIVADRFLFFSSIGFAIFLGYSIMYYINKNSQINSFRKTNSNFKVLSLIIFISFSLTIISRNSEWKNRITLYEADTKKMPKSVALNLLYSNEILVNLKQPNFFQNEQSKMQYIAKATVSLNNVLKVDSVNTTALNNLAFIKQNVYNDFTGAIPYYMKALSIDSSKFEVQFNLCYCFYKTGNFQKAEDLILKVYGNNPENQKVLDLLSYILIENKKSKKGIEFFNQLAKKQPDNNSINIILANFYISISDSLNAKTFYQKALQNDQNNPQLIEIVSKLSK